MNPRKDYPKALEMRLQGKSYGEIKEIFSIPKSTLSTWFSMLQISKEAQKILDSKRQNGYYKLVEFNKIRTQNIKQENENIRKKHEAQIKKLSNRELMILGAGLYWGEGYKNFGYRNGHYPYICFGNSDPKMILVFMRFLEKILSIPKERMKVQVSIYPNMIPNESVVYWQSLTQIPLKNFRYQVALSRASQGKRPKNLLPYGTLQIRVTKRQEFFKVMGFIDGIIKTF